ncbi:EAL domain-containing protein [Haliea sp. E1-2-M8]|uniref:EAL domain-containing protein n=1 Tax=Haliea sp. E1-2-M8 TaxID=3064706 RepID=UPI002715A941|nr:EAL domain-containing protein [Haliea sp. E1-2-M8]MDO8863571.1 EAL domain-containing protein [Haliea sp. E1-2-M8]
MTERYQQKKTQILVVEDSITQAEQLTATLQSHGHETRVAQNGEQALVMIQEQEPGLIISDVVMPKMDGYRLSSIIKADDGLKHIPLILVTTLSDPNDVLHGLECGADNFIRKPIDERYLITRIDYLLMNRELRLHQKTQLGLEIDLRGKRFFINSDRQQILDLLISTYEQAVDLNQELSRRERELAKSNEVLDSLYQIADDINRAVTARDVLDRVIDRVMELPDVAGAWITLPVQGNTDLFSIQAVRNLSFEIGDQFGSGSCHCLAGLMSGDISFPVNISNCECLRALLFTAEATCHATVPLTLASGRKMGVVNFLSPDEYGFDEAQLQLFSGVGNQLAVALERAELHENLERLVEERTLQVKRLNRLYSVLSGINLAIVRTRTQSELFDEVCRIAIDAGAFAFAWIGTVDSNGEGSVKASAHATGSGPSYEEIEEAVKAAEHPLSAEQQLQRGEVFILNNIAGRNKITTPWRDEYQSTAILPLFRGESLEAVCTLYSMEPDAFDDEKEMNLLREIAGDISFALDFQDKDRRLNYQAYYDGVTGLPNRTLFVDRLNQAVLDARQSDDFGAVLVLDLDRFKNVNDSLGHAAGDALLKAIGERLSSVTRDKDTVARLASDEFGLLCPALEHQVSASQIVSMLLNCFDQPITIAGNELFIKASLGVSVFPSDGAAADIIMQNAYAAMNRAKMNDGSDYQFYSSEMTSKAHERLTLENDLQRALDRNEFVLHYQPIIDAYTCQILGVETLIRWSSPERGLVPPFSFIPIAEETSLIVDIGAWVMEEACHQVASKWKVTAPELRLSVNVSTRQFLQSDFFDMITGVLDRTGMDPSRLALEITESHLMENIDEMIAIMHKLGNLGIVFSIDDFGTGYSSLSYLKNLPIANLKVDRSFVMNLPDNVDDVVIAKTIISLAHNLKQKVIAEGVETREQLEFLRAQSCDFIQGYYVSRPLPADELTPLLEKGYLTQKEPAK